METIKTITRKQQQDVDRLIQGNDYDWYVVIDTDGMKVCHHSSLSSIIECGHDPAEYGITFMEQCGRLNA